MKRKDLFKTRLLTLAALCGFMLSLASCANEEVVQNTTDADGNSDKNLTTFVTGTELETRTSMDYNTGDFYWEAGDYIYVQDDNYVLQRSSNTPTAKTAYFKFKVPGKFTDNTSYKVFYPGKDGSQNRITISARQKQSAPNTTTHFGESGDCGTANATKVAGKNQFEFKLDHQVAYLVFQPYTSNAILKNCYLTKIEVSSESDIAGTYVLTSTGMLLGINMVQQIKLSTGGGGFPLTNTSASVATNGTFMIIKPGTHKLRIRYWLKDPETGIEGTITKMLGNHTFDKNNYYNIIANLNVKDYDGNHYYMWDAQQQYWYGYEWTKNLPVGQGQPTINENSCSNYAQSNTDSRYYTEGYAYNGQPIPTRSCATLPNANEMSWYAMKGDPHFDGDELWTTMGHLYKGGMWFLKKEYIPGYRTDVSADGTTDLRTSLMRYSNNYAAGISSMGDASKYFYLPAFGHYDRGTLYGLGRKGYYWSSTPAQEAAYVLSFEDNLISVQFAWNRFNGFRVHTFE